MKKINKKVLGLTFQMSILTCMVIQANITYAGSVMVCSGTLAGTGYSSNSVYPSQFCPSATGAGIFALNGSPFSSTSASIGVGIDANGTNASTISLYGTNVAVKAQMDMENHQIKNLADGVATTDAVNLGQLNTAKADAIAQSNTYTDTAKAEAISTSNAYTDAAKAEAITTSNAYTDAAKAEAISTSNAYTDAAKADALATSNAYADAAKAEAISTSNTYTDAAKAEALAYTDAAKTEALAYTDAAKAEALAYTDTAKAEAITTSNAYTDVAKAEAISISNAYTDTAKANAINTSNAYTDVAKADAISQSNAYTDRAKAEAIATSKTYTDITKAEAINTSKAYTDAAKAETVAYVNTTNQNLMEFLGAGASYDTTTQNFSGPQFQVGGATYYNVGDAVEALDSRIDGISDQVHHLEERLEEGLAMSAAMAGLFQPYNVGKFNVSVAGGGYGSQGAIAVGSGFRFNQNVAIKAGLASIPGKGKSSYNVGMNFEW